MNKKWLSHIIAVGAFVVFIVLGACASTPNQWKDVSYNGEDSKVLEGNTYRLSVGDRAWWISRFETIEFHPRGSLQASYLSAGVFTGQPLNNKLRASSWERKGLNVKLVLEEGYYYGEGEHNPETNTISGTLLSTDGKKTNFSLVYIGPIGIR